MMALAAEGAAHRHTPADFATKTPATEQQPPPSRAFAFEKDDSGTWVITPTAHDSSHNSDGGDGVFMSITTSPPKSMAIYTGRAPDPSGSGSSSSKTPDAAPAQRIGTVKCHDTLSLKSDIMLNGRSYEMDRKFKSATGAGAGTLEWTSDMAAAAERKSEGELRSMMCLREAGKSSGGAQGRLLCRVLREEWPELLSPSGGKAGEGEHDEKTATSAGGEDKQQAGTRHTWRFTKGQIHVYSSTEDGLGESQVQELVVSALVELDRRARMQGNAVGAGGSTMQRLGAGLFRSIVGGA
ncbi:hypothetical protein Micbo1qcDRAFT_226283 [Microdochium bolleyi]|uniref:Uncharacterized protein n=1 Tax=Microdochium bolleyi TaxID=196109 RepID=A0A136IZK5_9PEZI|nr:hypothetical protein Micbo1qcDRAFT_226283 [Microdochium bolleyi]